MKAKFSQEQWYVNKNMPGFSGICISRFEPSTYWKNGHVDRVGDYPIATVHEGHNYWDKKYPSEENAKLIAAAPELLEVLECVCGLLKIQKHMFDDYEMDILNKVENAIKKATE